MNLKNKIDDFRQLQAHRKYEKNSNKKKLKTEFTALVRAEAGLLTYQANITVTLGLSISIIQQQADNGFRRRRVIFLAEDVETYNSDGNTMEINFKFESRIPDTQLMFETNEQRQSFEVAFRTFLGYSNPQDVNP